MKGIFRRDLITSVTRLLGVALLAPGALAGVCWACRKPVVDMPVSLAVGTVRTPMFPVKRQPYLIMIRAEKRLPFRDMNCMLGLEMPLPDPNCNEEPLLQADWTVWDDKQAVDRGSAHRRNGHGGWAEDSMDKFLGHFVGEKNKTYRVEVTFTTDGSSLNATNPHLMVMMAKPTDF